jgi:anti-anti-sigma factor
MTTTVVPNPPSAGVVLDGEMDIATCPAIRRFLMAAISGGDVHLAVDVSGVAFIDASGIGVLVAAANRARQAGGGLSLLAPSPQVRRLLDVLHLDAVLPIAERLAAPSGAGGGAWRLPRACRKDEGRCGSPAARLALAFLLRSRPALAYSHGPGVPSARAAFTVEGGQKWVSSPGCSFHAVSAVLCIRDAQ